MKTAAKKPKTDHVVLGQDCVRCLNCGAVYNISFPCPLNVMIATCKAFKRDHLSCKKRKTKENVDSVTPGDWLSGGDTGTSSETLWAVMTMQNVRRYDIPYDPSDFGRCYRLLNLFPSWQSRLGEVSARFPQWAPFVQHWDELTALYEEAIKNPERNAHKLYERMKALRTFKL